MIAWKSSTVILVTYALFKGQPPKESISLTLLSGLNKIILFTINSERYDQESRTKKNWRPQT